MASVLPATGTAISMGRTGRGYYGGAATTQVSFGNSAAVRRLNVSAGRAATANTKFSTVFGGKTVPNTY